ncbi:F-box/LRR-repeat protein 6 isoform X3 [Pteropus medius]|uniref:F-box/LRR-repeat protein 6 isoform X3 n=1 Tax=Pteropus vampyrus TaxID=132908 RepID=UPI00196AD034|nr:F-box/LRR-repeat protein 6 isoform X3 [Pteropus giganteus]
MAPGGARRARRRVRGAPPAGAGARSAEDWWWDRLAPSGSGYHLLQSDSMLLVLPGPGPVRARARAHRRAARRAQRLPLPGARAVAAKARPRPAVAAAPAPQQGPDPGWGDRIPLEILLQIFGLLVAADGPMPFLGRAARVCRRWHEAASQPALWHTVTLSPPLAGGRSTKGGAKAEKKLLASLEWLMPSRFSQLQKLILIHWKSQLHPVLKLVSESCPRLTFLKLSDCHGVTPDTLTMLARACPQLHSLDVQHSMVLRLLNLMWLPKPSGRAVTPGPGFPSLQELCLAGSTCSFVSDEALSRLLRGSPNLRLLDLRGCARITPAGLHDLPCQELRQLHLGLYGTSDRLTLAKEGSSLLTWKWCHTLRELDLSGQGFSEKDLEQALAAFSGTPGGSHPALCSLNLRGTRVTASTLCDQQLPRLAVPQPGILPLPSPGPKAGLPGPGGGPVVPGAAAHLPRLSQLGSPTLPPLPVLDVGAFCYNKTFLRTLCVPWDCGGGTGLELARSPCFSGGWSARVLLWLVSFACTLPGWNLGPHVSHPQGQRQAVVVCEAVAQTQAPGGAQPWVWCGGA